MRYTKSKQRKGDRDRDRITQKISFQMSANVDRNDGGPIVMMKVSMGKRHLGGSKRKSKRKGKSKVGTVNEYS